MPAGWRIAGLAAFFIGIALFVYAMSVNRFFSSVVRIQDERGNPNHRVGTTSVRTWMESSVALRGASV